MNISKPVLNIASLCKNPTIIRQTALSLILVVGLLTIGKNTSNVLKQVAHVFNYQVTQPQINDPHLIIKQMSAVSELTTSVFVMDAIVPTSSARKLGNVVLGETKLLYLARGEVKAGLDLSKIEPQDIRIKEDSITIKLPAPEILDRKIDVTKSQVYEYDRGFLNLGPDVAPQLQTQAQLYTLKQIQQNACEQKILEQANEKAVTLLTQLMTNAGYSNIRIIPQKSQHCLS